MYVDEPYSGTYAAPLGGASWMQVVFTFTLDGLPVVWPDPGYRVSDDAAIRTPELRAVTCPV